MQFLPKDGYFLSAENPLATADQRDLEARALALMETASFKQARSACERRWRELAGHSPPPEAWNRFQTFIDECAFANLLKALNGDPERPRVLRIVMPPHDWFGLSVPGSRFGGGPGADQSYAIVPVTYGRCYRIQGQWIGEPPADHNYTVSANAYYMNSIGTYHHKDIETDGDGRFELRVGPEPQGPNQLYVAPGAQYLFIRDCRSDWSQAATALQVEALDPPRTEAWTDEMILARAGQLMLDDASGMYYWIRFYQNMLPNTVLAPALTDYVGGLVAQTTSFIRIVLADDEAMVIEIEPAGAMFHDVQLNDYWFNSVGDYYARTATMNNAQTQLGADGAATYVVSVADPGVSNWLDPNGLRETLFVARWQRIPKVEGGRPPSTKARIVKLAELDELLGPDIKRVTPPERRAQQEARFASYATRLVDS